MEEKASDRLEKMQSLADMILEKIRIRIEQTEPGEINPQTLKHLTGVMKDLKDIQMLRSQADAEEQAAKIKNLQRQAQQQDSGTVTVQMAPELEAYCE